MKGVLIVLVVGVFILTSLACVSSAQNTTDRDQGESIAISGSDDEPDADGATPGNDANKPIKILTSTYPVTFNPLSYDKTHDNRIGQNQSIIVSQFTDKREGFDPQSTHIGTLYGMVYHQPMIEIHSKSPPTLLMQDFMKRLFLANGFSVEKTSAASDGALIVKGNLNTLWVDIYHSLNAEVDIDIEIIDPKTSKIVWSGKAKGSRAKAPGSDAGNVFFQGTLGKEEDMAPFLSEVLGEAISTAWAEKGLGNALADYSRKLTMRESAKRLTETEPPPNDAESNMKVAISHYELGQFDEAVKYLEAAIRAKPRWARAHYNLGLAFFKAKNKDAAIEQYDILKALDENYAKSLFEIIYKPE